MTPLEDNVADILSKAQRGLNFSDAELAAAAGVSAAAIEQARRGEFNETVVRQLAPVLQLNADALVALGRNAWSPRPVEPIPGFAAFPTPFDGMIVNAYLVWDTGTRHAAAFDTGTDCAGILKVLAANSLTLELILLTHGHGDHVAVLDELQQATGASAFIGELESSRKAKPFAAGQQFELGALRIETRQTSGHTRGGISYIVTGLARRLAIVGDAMFAGSMGGGLFSYAEALRTNREKILTLPDDTVICPGHGPLTTVGEEQRHNPFFASRGR